MNQEILLVVTLIAALSGIASFAGFVAAFQKAGQPGWSIFIPVYGQVVMARVAGFSVLQAELLVLLMCVPLVNLLVYMVLMVRFAQAFGKSGLYAVGLVLLPPVFACLLGFDSSRYIGPRVAGEAW